MALPVNTTPGWKSYTQTGNVSDIVQSTTVAAAIGGKVDAVGGQVDCSLGLYGNNSGYTTMVALTAATALTVSGLASLQTKATSLSADGTTYSGRVTGATSGDVSNATTGVQGASTVSIAANLAAVAVSGTFGYAGTSTVDHAGVGIHYRGDLSAAYLIYSAQAGSDGNTTDTAAITLYQITPQNAPGQLSDTAALGDVITAFNNLITSLKTGGTLK